MGLLFSKLKKSNAITPVHPHHPSTVSYDFNTSKGQIRALRAAQEIKQNGYPKKQEKAKVKPSVRWR